MGNAGSAIKNFFENDVASMGNAFEGFASALGTTLGGLFTGNFDYSSTKRHFANYGNDVARAFTNRSVGSISQDVSGGGGGGGGGVNYSQVAPYSSQIDQNLSRNVSAVSTGFIAKAMYSPQSGLGGTIPPSQLLSMSNPAAKLAIAGSRGALRNSLNMVGNGVNMSMAPALSSALPGGATSAADQVSNGGVLSGSVAQGSSSGVNLETPAPTS